MSDQRASVSIDLNGGTVTELAPVNQMLADFLRGRGIASVRISCDQGVCGACTVLVDGQPTASCATFAFQADGCDVLTVEGLGGRDLHPVQQAFVDRFALQCGYCTPGMVLTAVALLEQEPEPTPEVVRGWMAGNVCRCTGYAAIVDAVLDSACRHHDSRGRS